MVAVAVDAPLECKGGGAHGGVVVLVATVGAVVESFKGTSKTWSRYWSSPTFRRRSGDSGRGLHTCGVVSLSPSMRRVCHIAAFVCCGCRCSASRCSCGCCHCGTCIMVVAFVLRVVLLLPFSHHVGCCQCLCCIRCGVAAAARGAVMRRRCGGDSREV